MPVVCCFWRIQWLGFRYSRNPLYICHGIKRYWTSWIYSTSRSNHTCIWRNLGFPCIECKTDYWRICCLKNNQREFCIFSFLSLLLKHSYYTFAWWYISILLFNSKFILAGFIFSNIIFFFKRARLVSKVKIGWDDRLES